jgi:hypothetical protein
MMHNVEQAARNLASLQALNLTADEPAERTSDRPAI